MKPKLVIIPTVDVEGVHGDRPFEQLVLGEIDADEPWGVAKIARILDRYGASGTFFIDVYEYTFWGMDPWERLCVWLAERGQDVQLHTHPGWRDDRRDYDWIRELKRTKSFLSQEKDFMAKLNLSEQIGVLRHGSELLASWLGVRPIAHRSGGYSVDENTILALQEVGLKIDSSQNRAHSNSKLYWTFNALAKQNDVLQIPITIYERCFVASGPRLPATYRRLKTSVHALESELIDFCKVALEIGLPVMNLFMHSYSLLKMDKYYKKVEPNLETAWCLDSILKWAVEHPQIEIMSIAQYYKSGLWQKQLSPDTPDVVPRFAHAAQLVDDLFHKIRYTLA